MYNARKTRACSVRRNNVVYFSLHIIEFACRVIIIMIEVEIEMEIIVYLSHAPHQSGPPLLPLLVELLYDELL